MVILSIASIACGFISAACWLKASFSKVTREQEIAWRRKQAVKQGIEPNLATVSLDGYDLSGTFRSQTKWNSLGAIFAALTILLQSFDTLVTTFCS